MSAVLLPIKQSASRLEEFLEEQYWNTAQESVCKLKGRDEAPHVLLLARGTGVC